MSDWEKPKRDILYMHMQFVNAEYPETTRGREQSRETSAN